MANITVSLWSSTATFRRGSTEKMTFLLLQQADLILTTIAVSLGLQEINPLMKTLLTVPYSLLVVKVGIPLLIAWLAPGKLLLPAIVLLGLVVGWNIKELLIWL